MMVSPKAAQPRATQFGAKPSARGRFARRARGAGQIVLDATRTTGTEAEFVSTKSSTPPIVDSTVRLTPICARDSSTSSSGWPVPTCPRSRPTAASRSPGSRRSAIRASPSTSGRSDLAQKIHSADARCAKLSSSLSIATASTVAMDGEAAVGQQWVAPANAYYSRNVLIPKRDVARAKAAAGGGRHTRSKLYAGDSLHVGCAEDCADRAGDGQ